MVEPTYSRSLRRSLAGFLGLLLLVGTSACSAVLGWDPQGLMCDPNVPAGSTGNPCLPGYSCNRQTKQCIALASRGLGQICTDTPQCQSDEVCPIDTLDSAHLLGGTEVQTCRQACKTNLKDNGYFQVGACPEHYFCRPYLNDYYTSQSPQKDLMGACVPTDSCAVGTACALAASDSAKTGKCFAITGDANACLPSCEVTVTPPAAYKDSCAGDFICQPLGQDSKQDFTCVYNGFVSQPEGAACATVSAPCSRGYVCSPDSKCAQYCQVTASGQGATFSDTQCPSNQTCCSLEAFMRDATNLNVGYCATSCKGL